MKPKGIGPNELGTQTPLKQTYKKSVSEVKQNIPTRNDSVVSAYLIGI